VAIRRAGAGHQWQVVMTGHISFSVDDVPALF
jgi:hypothetical protein